MVERGGAFVQVEDFEAFKNESLIETQYLKNTTKKLEEWLNNDLEEMHNL